MTQDEIIKLLQLAAAHDRRTIGQADVAVWTDASQRGRWTFGEACEAINGHNHDRPDAWLKPGHVTERIRAARQEAAMREPVALPDPIGQRRVAELAAVAFRAIGDDGEDRARRRAALAVRCPWCGSSPGQSCTKLTRRGRAETDPHPSRVEASAA